MHLRSFGDRRENESTGVLTRVGDLCFKAASRESGSSSFQVGTIGRALELEVGRSWVGKGKSHDCRLLAILGDV
jgi:hypothetical protein